MELKASIQGTYHERSWKKVEVVSITEQLELSSYSKDTADEELEAKRHYDLWPCLCINNNNNNNHNDKRE